MVPAAQERRKTVEAKTDCIIDVTITEEGGAVSGYEDVIVAAPGAAGDGCLPQADLLTQAMTELISTQADFRPGSNITVHAPETIQLGRFVTGAAPTLIQVRIGNMHF